MVATSCDLNAPRCTTTVLADTFTHLLSPVNEGLRWQQRQRQACGPLRYYNIVIVIYNYKPMARSLTSVQTFPTHTHNTQHTTHNAQFVHFFQFSYFFVQLLVQLDGVNVYLLGSPIMKVIELMVRNS